MEATSTSSSRSSAGSRLFQRYLRAPEHPAKLRLVRWLGRRFYRGFRTELPDGIVLYLTPADWIEYLLLKGDDYEPLTRRFIRRNLRPGDGAVFAGVNFGLHVIDAARAAGPSGCIVGVEPQPASCERARRNIAENAVAGQIRIVQAALAATAGRTTMVAAPPNNAGAASLLTPGEGFDVELMPLSDVERALDGRPFRLLLLDVQGYELPALQGLGTLPDVIVCEADEEWTTASGHSAEVLAEHLRQRGYELFDVRGSRVTAVNDLPERNIIAVMPLRAVVMA